MVDDISILEGTEFLMLQEAWSGSRIAVRAADLGDPYIKEFLS